MYRCAVCKIDLEARDAYEYRGAISCADHFDKVSEMREVQRREVIAEESAKREVFRGIDLGYGKIGKANRELLKPNIEIASKDSSRLKRYEGRE